MKTQKVKLVSQVRYFKVIEGKEEFTVAEFADTNVSMWKALGEHNTFIEDLEKEKELIETVKEFLKEKGQ